MSFWQVKSKDESTSLECASMFAPGLKTDLCLYSPDHEVFAFHSLARYHWAKNIILGYKCKRVLDIGSGSGYGSYIIARSNPETDIIGIDVDESAISYSTITYNLPNLRFIHHDCSLPLCETTDNTRFDAVCLFETLALVRHRDIALLRVRSALNTDGILLFSSACSRYHSQVSDLNFEYGYADLGIIMKQSFLDVRTHEDQNFPNSSFWDDLNCSTTVYDNKWNPVFCATPRAFK